MPKIMVVDDEPKLVEVLEEMLEKEGYNVVGVYSGEECLQRIEKEMPDLVLLDVMMPHMDGWEVCKKIKQNKHTKDITVAMLTVKSEDEDKVKSFDEAIADWHIAKHIERKKLLQTVKWLLTAPMQRK